MSAALRRVAILGSTGSIGRQALEVIRSRPDHLQVVGLVAGTDEGALAEQAAASNGVRTGLGEDAAVEMARADDVDVVVNAIVGAAGLRASVSALQAGKRLALANKESLVAGGEVCLAAASATGASIVPIDSEHASLAQCLRHRADVRKVVLTASGGPFRTRTDLEGVTPDEALAHPTWSMGPKITIDSATLMNKGLEVIEAHYLFGTSYDDIEVLVHPQSIVHAMVELDDGSLLMHAAAPDMRLPIQTALLEADETAAGFERLNLATAPSLDFEALNTARFPAVALAYDAGRRGGSFPAVLNAANEVAVHAFLAERLSFTGIVEVVQEVLGRHKGVDASTLDGVLEADRWARSEASSVVEVRAMSLTGGAR